MATFKHCPNPSCPHRASVGSPAEYRLEIDTCGDCGTTLVFGTDETVLPVDPAAGLQLDGPVVTIARGRDPRAAGQARALLQSEGIHSSVVGDHAAGVFGSTLGLQLRVLGQDVSRACEVLAANRVEGLALDSEAPGSDDGDEALAGIAAATVTPVDNAVPDLLDETLCPLDLEWAGDLEWVETVADERFLLVAMGRTCCILERKKIGVALARTAHESWLFRKRRQRVQVLEPREESVIGELNLSGDPDYELLRPDGAGPLTGLRWGAWESWDSEEDWLIRYHDEWDGIRMEVDPSVRHLPELLLLIALGWYMRRLIY